MDLNQIYRIFLSCSGVTTDSRRCPEGSLFIALRGENFDGNAYAAKALEAGSAYAVVDRPEVIPEGGDPRYLLTDNSLRTLQALARLHRRTLGTRMLAITGTNGKTTTKELVSAVLARRYRVLHTEGNLNNHIGVPLTLLRLRPEHELAVVEMGASHPGDIRELVDIAEPDMGLITNVGRAHLLGFGSLEGVMRTKGELFDYLREHGRGPAFVCQDDERVRTLAEGLEQVRYGSGTLPAEGAENYDVTGHAIGSHSPYLSLLWQCTSLMGQCTSSSLGAGEAHTVHTHLIGDYNLPNVLAAAAVGSYLGVPAADINQALEAYVPSNNRSQLVQTAHNTLVVDAYNANPTSMRASITNFLRLAAPAKLLILGDMRELGSESAAEHQRIVDLLVAGGLDQTAVVLVGTEFTATHHPFPSFPDAPTLIAALQADRPTGRTILIKGSNGVKLSTVVPYL